jgi:hypothetical protein
MFVHGLVHVKPSSKTKNNRVSRMVLMCITLTRQVAVDEQVAQVAENNREHAWAGNNRSAW